MWVLANSFTQNGTDGFVGLENIPGSEGAEQKEYAAFKKNKLKNKHTKSFFIFF